MEGEKYKCDGIRKKFLIIVTLFLMIFLGNSYSFGKVTGSKTLQLYNGNQRPSGYYTVNRYSHQGPALPVIKIIETGPAKVSQTPEQANKMIYCLQDGVGFGTESSQGEKSVEYTVGYDMRKDITEIQSSLKTSTNLESNDEYHKLMWLLDNICNASDEESVNNLLTAAQLSKDTDFSSDKLDESKFQDVIEVIQQTAIWYLTNQKDHNDYRPADNPVFQFTEEERIPGRDIEEEFGLEIEDSPVGTLFQHLIEKANENAEYDYTHTPVLATLETTNVEVEVKEGDAIYIGPYKINGDVDTITKISITYPNSSGASAPLVDKNKTNEVTDTAQGQADKLKNLLQDDFYIKVPMSEQGKQVKIEISTQCRKRNITYWTTTDNQKENTQPVVIIEDEEESGSSSNTQTTPGGPSPTPSTETSPTPSTETSPTPSTGTSPTPSTETSPTPSEETSPTPSAETSPTPSTGTPSPDQDKLDIEVEKQWVEKENESGKVHDEDIKVTVYKNGEPTEYTNTLNSDNDWHCLFEDLDKSENGQDIEYTVKEREADGYTASVSKSEETDENGHKKVKFTMTNTADEIAKKQITVIKKWDDDNNLDGIRPGEITVHLLKNGSDFVAEGKLNEDNHWEYTFDDLPVLDENGEKIQYSVEEVDVPEGYQASYKKTEDAPVDWTITNTHTPNSSFDLALRKFITTVNEKELKTGDRYDREPEVDITPLLEGRETANYKHKKDPVKVSVGDIVTYTLRIYNEGTIDGYAEEIVDHLPPELEFLPDDELNQHYLWEIDASDSSGRTIKTRYLSEERSKDNILKGFDGETLDYKDIQVRCRVVQNAPVSKKLTNIAEITESKNDRGIPDRDNKDKVVLPRDENLPDYKGKDTNKDDLSDEDYYYEGQEDDDDFEKLIVEKFDLNLKKFITKVNDQNVTDREPEVDPSRYGTVVDGKEITDMEYKLKKDKEPLRVSHNDIIIYTIRVYNEGTKAGYAAEIKDDIPDGLEYILDHEINIKYGWILYDAEGNETREVENGVTLRTRYLSKENESREGENLLQGFDKDTMETPDYRDVQLAFRVKMPNTDDRIVKNHAEISENTDENGDQIKDVDSIPNGGEDEDDEDDEHIYVKYFDLSLEKWLSQVILIEDGVQKEMDTGNGPGQSSPEQVVKVELNKDRIENTIIKFKYLIRVTNEGEIEGYATEISDYVPDGLKFNQADNSKWREANGKVVTDQLKDTLLQPGECATVELLLTWINDANNLSQKVNVAEISDYENPSDTPDNDSTSNNKKDGEDDLDNAPAVLTVVTGRIPLYISLVAGIVAIIGVGALAIKKFVI